jgi:nickel superoxide dismutase
LPEHITTIEKSLNTILQLEKETPVNYNQLVRWVNNKDHHADELADIVSYYFLAQRIKPVETQDEKVLHEYGTKLELLHQMLYYAMKAKQTTELANVEKLRALLDQFHKVYFDQETQEKHSH